MLLERYIDFRENGIELKKVMKQGMKLSSTMISRLKIAQGIYVNNAPVYTNYICRTGDVVRLDLSVAEPTQNMVPEHGDLLILYEDDLLIAVDKPTGMLTHPSRAQYTGTLSGFVSGYLSTSGEATCHSLNRLDRYTSGIVLFAKNAYAKALCDAVMQEAKKDYMAIAYGKVECKTGVINVPIKRMESGNMLRGVAEDGIRAVTNYELLDVLRHEGSELSLLKLRLETGRTHQIRVHCTSIGHPIIGDQLYFSTESKAFSDKLSAHGQMLHAERLCFNHPITGELIDIRCPITRMDMRALLHIKMQLP